VVIDN